MVTNKDGEIKCITSTGEIKWFSKLIVSDEQLMKERGFKIFEKPEQLLPEPNQNAEIGENPQGLEPQADAASEVKPTRGRKPLKV